MKKDYKIILIVLGIVIGFVIFGTALFMGKYNTVVSLEEQVNESYSNIEIQEKRRADLIPNYVDSIKDYKNFEQETLTQVIEARSQAENGNVEQAQKTLSKLREYRA